MVSFSWKTNSVVTAVATAWLWATTSVEAYNQISRRQILEGQVEVFSEEEEPSVLRPKHLKPGELATVVRRDTGARVDRGGYFIGLPEALTLAFQKYVQESGLMDLAQDLMYKNPVKADEKRIYKMEDGTTWGVRTSNNWVDIGDMTWIDPADEWTYEFVLDIYRKHGFDHILDTLGEKYENNGLWLDGTSFIIVSHLEGDNMHTDLEGQEGNVFNIIFPIVIPSTGGQLELADRDNFSDALGANFRYHQGVLLGGETPHGTGNVDYRPTKEFRMAIAVYMDDFNEDTVYEFDDDTASFPPGGDLDYLMTHAGRHWGGDASLKNDKGRDSYDVQDADAVPCAKWEAEGRCLESLEVRNVCLKTCKTLLEDSVYSEMFGKIMGWPTESVEQ